MIHVRLTRLLACFTGCLLVAGCNRGFTVDTFAFTRSLKAGETVQRADLKPISIPFRSHGESSGNMVTTPESAERLWITADELDRFLGQALVKDAEAGEQLIHKLFAPED